MHAMYLVLVCWYVFFVACLVRVRAQASNKKDGQHNQNTIRPPMIVAASCGTKNNNASLQSNNYGQLNHTDGKSYCSVSYLEERLIAE